MPSRHTKFTEMQDEPFVYAEVSAESAVKREREFIDEKMNDWLGTNDALNAACRAFSNYYFYKDVGKRIIDKKEREITKLKKREKGFRRDLAIQVALCATREEHEQFNIHNHGQVVDWLVKQPFSPLPKQASRWAWVKERNDLTCCNPGPNDNEAM
ncbi:hypothetical protein D1007_51455 [Hordeum vulgare]|nr:hypothetical protein D1007_51455 [Hordeum vulgare]